MLLKRFAFTLLMVLSGILLLAAIGVPLFTYSTWQHGSFLHKLEAEGIDTKVKITSAHVHCNHSLQPEDVTFNIAWTDQNGGAHTHQDASPGLDYGMQFLTRVKTTAPRMPVGDTIQDYIQAMCASSYALSVDEAPIRYLASDPEQFIFSALPRESAEDINRMLPWLVAASVLSLANVPFFIMLERIRKRRKALATTQPGGAAAEEKLDRQALWILLTLMLYTGLVSLHFLPGIQAYDVKTFGTTPLGLPVTVAVIACGTVLFLPYVWVNWHVVRLAREAGSEGVHGRATLLLYLLTGGGHAHLRNSCIASWLGQLYFLGLLSFFVLLA
jgi:hypothetical protein